MRWHRSRLPAIPLRSPALRPTSSSTSVGLWNVKTGKFAMTGPGWVQSEIGEITGDVTEAGVYIAQVTLPEGASYGDITISQ